MLFIDLSQREEFWCRLCNIKFESNDELDRHHWDSTNHFPCTYCSDGIDWNSEEGLLEHLLQNHEYTYCQSCQENHTDPSWLRLHCKTSSRNVCDCGFWFDTPELLKAHWETSTVHTKTYCRFCEQNFPEPDYLSEHFESACPETTKWPRLYETIGIDGLSSQEEIERAAKQKRVECHPGQLRKPGSSLRELREIDARARAIEYAVEILADPTLRRKYDYEVAAAWAR